MNTTSSLASLLFLAAAICAAAQTITSDELIDRELSTFDLRAFEWEGEPDPVPPRLGFYFNGVPKESVAAITGRAENDPWFVIWHVMPHWSADEAGILIGDTLISIDGKRIGNESASGLDYLDLLVKSKQPGEELKLTIRRNGNTMNIPVPLIGFERTPTSYSMPPRLGPIRDTSWLSERIEENGLVEWAREIQRQMKVIADMDFSRVKFAGRPNPWRLNVVTALHNNPTRTGAYSRLIVDDLWSGANGPLAQAIRAAANHLDIPRNPVTIPDLPEMLPGTIEGLSRYLSLLNEATHRAYAHSGSSAGAMVQDLHAILDPTLSWESELDSIADPLERKAARDVHEKRIADLFAHADRVDLPLLVQVAQLASPLADTNWLLPFTEQLNDAEEYKPTEAIPGVEGSVIAYWETEQGRCVIGGKGRNSYSGDLMFVIDLGGDDLYLLDQITPGSLRIVADLAGNDLYRSDGAAQGSGVGGIDILVDVSGDDTYRADNYAQGSAMLGVGVLADLAGDDVYTSHWCSQGAAFLGVGLLYDAAGSDTYSADLYAQGFGYAKGIGVLLDRAGNDSYRAGWKYEDSRYPNRAHIAMSQGFGFGMRPWATGIGTDGGIGLLSDLDGDDLYAGDFFSQGGSYWYALGILHDGAGADRYTAGQYSQGSGIHLSFGALLDDGGDDMYDAYAGLEQGNAHDWSAGCLEDLAGNDTYRGSTSSQGSALNVAFAWLLDREGNDRYYAHIPDSTISQGGGNYSRPREHGSLGMLLDFGNGSDFYTDEKIVPNELLRKKNGVVWDDGE